jgi:hypothetical protein
MLPLREARERLYRLVGQLAEAPWEPVVITRGEDAGREVVAVVVSPVLWRAMRELLRKQPVWPEEVVPLLEGVVAWQRAVQDAKASDWWEELRETEEVGRE